VTGDPVVDPVPAVITLLSRSGCHLCEQARTVVVEQAMAAGVDWAEVDVDTDPELRADFGDLVPVVLVDGIEHAHYRVDPQRLLAALRARPRS
jgi:glutaredoxin